MKQLSQIRTTLAASKPTNKSEALKICLFGFDLNLGKVTFLWTTMHGQPSSQNHRVPQKNGDKVIKRSIFIDIGLLITAWENNFNEHFFTGNQEPKFHLKLEVGSNPSNQAQLNVDAHALVDGWHGIHSVQDYRLIVIGSPHCDLHPWLKMGQRLGVKVNRYPSSGYHCSNNCCYRRSGNWVVVELSVVAMVE